MLIFVFLVDEWKDIEKSISIDKDMDFWKVKRGCVKMAAFQAAWLSNKKWFNGARLSLLHYILFFVISIHLSIKKWYLQFDHGAKNLIYQIINRVYVYVFLEM